MVFRHQHWPKRKCDGLHFTSSAPTAIRTVANTYCQLLLSQSDNDVKLIVLDRIAELKSSHREIMVEIVKDVLRALASPIVDIRRKTLDIALDLITPRNVDEVVLTLKKEVVKTQSTELEKNVEHRQMLIQAIHSYALKFPEVASTVVHLLMDFLGDSNIASAIEVVLFVREIIKDQPEAQGLHNHEAARYFLSDSGCLRLFVCSLDHRGALPLPLRSRERDR